MERRFFDAHGVRLSYVDFGGAAQRTLVALHGHFGTATMFTRLAKGLPEWRVVALDQRGHGWSSHAVPGEYGRKNYTEDLQYLIERELGAEPVVLVGHSLGGVNAYQFAAMWPSLVRAMVIEDIGTEIEDDQSWAMKLPSRVATLLELREALESLLGADAFTYFGESAVEYADGWTFRFDARGLVHSAAAINGTWWGDWQATACPVLLMHGEQSSIFSWENARKMAACRPNTQLRRFPGCGHTIRNDDPVGYIEAIRSFLSTLPE